MGLNINLGQKLSQNLKLSPQLQQSIKLLQLGRMELIEEIQKELLENPVLELIEIGEPLPPESASKTKEEIYDFFDDGPSFASDKDANRQFIENTLIAKESLIEHLLRQLQERDLSSMDWNIACELIGDLDKDGYLTSSLEELAAVMQVSALDVERVLSEVQSLEPAGIAARNLRESLLLQLQALARQDSLAWKIVDCHLSLLEQGKYRELCQSLDVDSKQLSFAISEIKHLQASPARIFAEDATIYLVPDIFIYKAQGVWLASTNPSALPTVELNKSYQEIYHALDKQSLEAKKYLNQNIKNAVWLIRSLEQRAETLQKVALSIVRFQFDFFESGQLSDLKQLFLKQVADDIGMHESTISRATSQKYVNTPHGTFELKYFFSAGFASGLGSSMSSEGVKEKIRNLIQEENPNKPLSDQAIQSSLSTVGLNLARRTVAKYREELGIASSASRKKESLCAAK